MKRLFTLISVFFFTFSSFGQTRITTAVVHFRSTPEMRDNIICTIPKGTMISLVSGIIPCRRWLAVEYKGKIGWVNRTYLKPKAGATNSKLSTTNCQLSTIN